VYDFGRMMLYDHSWCMALGKGFLAYDFGQSLSVYNPWSIMWSDGLGRMILSGWLRADDSRQMILGSRAQLL